ncbi:MAG TPA: hypothetical protein VMR49_02060 [Candidatus Paceibacterota bacterium]|jgi:hypothetical protein|nr:hypothetical protein [Candidatus Paceibacterota bacterium]
METRNCQNCKKDFIIEPDDFSFYEKIKVPAPTWCPECRSQRRLSWRNEFIFYNRTCDLCKRNIISIYSPDNPQIIYCNKCWWGDIWDPKKYAQSFDFSKPFFEQFNEFRMKIPTLALVNDNTIGSTNCEYTQDVVYSKDCYMTIVSWKIENCMYFAYGVDAKDIVDSMGIMSKSEGLYEALYSQDCFGSKYIQDSNTLVNCIFCYDCRGCSNCFMCVGLRNKKFNILNKQYVKEEYEKIIANYSLDSWTGVEKAKKQFNEFIIKQPRKYANFNNCLNCTGNNLANSKNSKDAFHTRRLENSRYIENGDTQKDSYDLSVGGELEQCYEGITPDHSTRALFVNYVWKSLDVLYSDFCMSCQECFGCVGLKHCKYSIFNKEYTKDEYFELKNKIIEYMKKTGEWGEFFPMSMSSFAYNESMAMLYFPLSKENVLRKGFRWQNNIQQTRGKTTLFEVSDNINDISDSITDEILECLICKRNYKIVNEELNFYKKWKIPIPRHCFFCRLENRFKLRGPSKLWQRQCMCDKKHPNHEGKCQVEFETSYAPDRPEIVYCEKCYQQEVY